MKVFLPVALDYTYDERVLMAAVRLSIQGLVFTILCLSRMGHVMAIRSDYRHLFSRAS